MIDGSDSVDYDTFQASLTIVQKIAGAVPVSPDGSHVAVAVFAEDTHILSTFDSNSYTDNLIPALDYANRPGGGRYTGYALKNIEDEVFAKDYQR